MANVSKEWIDSVSFKVVGGTEYVFTARAAKTIADDAHRAALMATGCFSESGNDLTYTGKVSVEGDDGALYEVDSNADLTVDDTNISGVPAGVIQNPA